MKGVPGGQPRAGFRAGVRRRLAAAWVVGWCAVMSGAWAGNALAAQAPGAERPESLSVRIVPVAPGLTILMGAGGNVGVSTGEDGVLLIDDQYARIAPAILEAVHTLSAGPLRFVINTHKHGDHTGSNLAMDSAGAIIVAQENVRKRMSVDQFLPAYNRTIPASPPGALPVVTFADQVTFHWNGTEIRVFHVANAHTDGDAVVWFPALNVIHLGDTYFNGSYPFIDDASGGTLDGMVAAVDQVLPLLNDSTRVIPGHGPPGTTADLRDYRTMLATVRDRLTVMARRKLTVEQAQASKPTREFEEKWGHGFLDGDAWVALMYRLVTGT